MSDSLKTINSEDVQENTQIDEQGVMEKIGWSHEDTEYKKIIEKKPQLVVVVSASTFNALGVVRSLGAAGYTVDLVSSVVREGRSEIVASSKYINRSVETISMKMKEESDEQLLTELLKYAGKYKTKPVLFPADDYTTSVVDLNRDKLEDIFVMPGIVGGKKGSLNHYMDKSVQSAIAKKVGVLTPKEWVISLKNEDIIIPEDMIYPCFCKPLESSLGAKKEQVKCDNEDELRTYLYKLRENYADRSILVQEFLNLDEEIVMNGVCIDQEIILPAIICKEVVGQSLRGSSIIGKICPVEKLGEEVKNKIINMLKEYHYVGMFDLELNVVGEKTYFNEFNLRSGGTNYADFKSGINLPDLFVKGILGQEYAPEETVVAEYGKTYLRENMAWRDCIHGFLSRSEIEAYMKTVDITLVYDSDDPEPSRIFMKDIDNRLRRKQEKEKKKEQEEAKKAAVRENAVQAVMEKTGWSHEDAEMRMKEAKERIGVKYTEYNKYGFYNIAIEDQETEYKKIIEKKSQLVVVLSGNTFNGLGVVRSLGTAGYTVDLMTGVKREGQSEMIASSKYVNHSVETISKKMKEENDEQLLSELLKYSGRYKIKPVLFPTNDYTTSFMDLNRDKLEDIFVMPCIVDGKEGSLRHYMDKSVQSAIAKKVGLLTPKEWVISLKDEDIIIPEDMIYPCYCKPLESSLGVKKEQLKCGNEGELRDHLQELRENYADRSILVQEFLCIDTEIDMNGVCIDQEIILPLIIGKEVVGQAEKGASLAGKTYPVEKLGEEVQNKIINMMKEYHYIGMFDLELNVVGENIYFNELNLRSGGPNYVNLKSGVNLPELFVKGILGQEYTAEETVATEYGKTFFRENMAWVDYFHGFLSRSKIEAYMKAVDITWTEDSDDPKPGKIFMKDINSRIRKQEKRGKREDYISIVTEATGWDRDYAIEKMKRSQEVTGTNYEYYATFRFWELSEEVQKTYFSKGDADRLNQRYNKYPKIRKMFVNKDLFCANFEKYLGRPWLSTKELTAEEFKNKFGNSGKIIFKPRSSMGGYGIRVFEFDETTINGIYEEICALPVGVLEGYVVQHPEMQKLSLNSVNTIRVVTINTRKSLPDVEKNKVNFVYAGIRMGYGDSFADNLHSGGMIAGVDLETGVVETHGYNRKNEEFVKHPDTGITIKGFQIPFYSEIKQLIEEAGEDIPGYFGWDIAVTENGPIIIEVNTHPGPGVLQTPYVHEQKGMRYVVEKYLAEPETKKKKKAAKPKSKQEGYISTVIEATGWDRDYAEEQMKRAQEITGTSYEHYAIYRFWELSEEAQKTYFSKGDADQLNERYNKDPKILKFFVNKDLFCAKFEKYLGRPWLSNKEITLEGFKKKFGNSGKIIFKPRASSSGHGICVFEFNENTIDDVFQTICTLPAGVLEGYVDQHSEMKKLSLNSVNTVRVVTVNTSESLPGVKKNKVNFVYAGVRMGRGDSVVDTLHSGGIMAVIDLETGVVETHGYNRENEVFVKHPDTEVTIKGFQIPYFNEIKQLIEEAGGNIPGYFGWDIAITENGPVIIEVNTRPGSIMLQIPYAQEQKGMRYMIEKYLAEPQLQIIPETPYGTKISGITKEGIEFYWKKLERASGYYIFRAYNADGPFEQIAEIKKRSIGTYIDSEFDRSQKTVYYTLCSFLKNEDGTYICSKKVAPQAAVFREELVLEREATYLYSGTTRSIRAFYGWGEVDDAQWRSSDESIAAISPEGVINAVSSGECTLICTSETLGKKAETKVVVDRKACEPLTEINSRFKFNSVNGIWENTDAVKTNDAVIMMVGDMMCGKMQMKKQYTKKKGWNFNDSFTYVKEITAGADFSIGNLETLLAAGWPYMLDETYIDNKNNCNATSRYLDAVRYGGFDAVAMANNHNCDGGKPALYETIEQVDKYQLARTGLFRDEADKRFFIADVNGIKVGFLAYISKATGFNGKDKDWAREDKDVLLNVFTKEKAVRDIAECRAAGAEYVIVYMHWGVKNHRTVASHQFEDAQAVADSGADYIVGGNPHVLQVYDVIKSKDGRSVPCVYSTGNFQAVMNQIEGNRDSVILRIRLKKDADGKVVLAENNYIPCYTYTACEQSNWAPVSLSDRFNTEVKKAEKDKILNRIKKAMGDKLEML